MLILLSIIGEFLVWILLVTLIKYFRLGTFHVVLLLTAIIVFIASFGIYINIKYPDSNFAFGRVINGRVISYDTPSGKTELNYDNDDTSFYGPSRLHDIVKLDSNYQNATLIKQEWNKYIYSLRMICIAFSYVALFVVISCIFIFKSLYIVYGGTLAMAIPTINALLLFSRPDSNVNKVKYIVFSILCGIVSVGLFYLFYKFGEKNREKLKNMGSSLEEKLNIFCPFVLCFCLMYIICQYFVVLEYCGIIFGKFLTNLF